MLSILCVTKAEPHAMPFLGRLASLAQDLDAELVLAVDGGPVAMVRARAMGGIRAVLRPVTSLGYLESVLDEAVAECTRNYVLRLDDDEACTPAMRAWLAARYYTDARHWKFPRAHLWPAGGDFVMAIANAPLWPDHQTRLSLRGLSGGRTTVHAGSPHGGGELAPVAIEHHKFLVKTVAERRAIAARYDAVQPGYGTGGMLPFNVPEDVFKDPDVVPLPALCDRAVTDAQAVRA